MPARVSSSPWKYTAEWGDGYARRLWETVLAPAEMQWEDSVVLDVGCHWGYLLKHLLVEHGIGAGHGVDVEAHWADMSDGSDPTSLPGLHLHKGRVDEIQALATTRF